MSDQGFTFVIGGFPSLMGPFERGVILSLRLSYVFSLSLKCWWTVRKLDWRWVWRRLASSGIIWRNSMNSTPDLKKPTNTTMPERGEQTYSCLWAVISETRGVNKSWIHFLHFFCLEYPFNQQLEWEGSAHYECRRCLFSCRFYRFCPLFAVQILVAIPPSQWEQ